MDYEKICMAVCGIAREAGEYIAAERKTFSFADVEFKGAQNMVSYVDKTAEEMIVGKLRELTPGAEFITEEGTAVEGAKERGTAQYAGTQQSDTQQQSGVWQQGTQETGTSQQGGQDNPGRLKWIIDPLDGTTNFIHGLPPYCVSIGLMENDELVMGIVYEITLKEMFYAWKGSKAYLNGGEISVSATDRLENSLIAVGFAYDTVSEVEGYLESMADFQRNTNGIRRIGSATADLVYVACGRFDAFHQAKLSAWDVAAGAFVCLRAGAVVSDYDGGGDYIFGRRIIASNPHVYEEFRRKVK